MATPAQKEAVRSLERTFKDYKGSYVYLIKCNDKYKIGRAWDIDNRLNSLQCGNPYELELVWAARITDSVETEGLLHEHFSAKRIFREWFGLTDEDVKTVKSLTLELPRD